MTKEKEKKNISHVSHYHIQHNNYPTNFHTISSPSITYHLSTTLTQTTDCVLFFLTYTLIYGYK